MKGIDLNPFFKDRLKELTDLNSLDTYRVRHHNVNTILREVRDFIVGWQNNRVKRIETVQLSIEEALSLMEKDEVLLYTDIGKANTIKKLKSFDSELSKLARDNKNKVSFTRIIFLLSDIISLNKEVYLENLLNAIESFLLSNVDVIDENFVPTVERLDGLVSSLARELIDSGYSKRGLFNIVRVYPRKINSIEVFRSFKKKLLVNRGSNHKVILALQGIPKGLVLSNFHQTIDKSIIPPQYHDARVDNFLAQKSKKSFFIHDCVASDGHTAVKKAKTKLSEEIDSINLYFSDLNVKIMPHAMVVGERDGRFNLLFLPTCFFLDDDSRDLAKANFFRKKTDNILNSQYVCDDLKDRLVSALRHLRIGNTDGEIEQRFINYWIALEYIFSSPMVEENTFERLKTNLSNILFVNYVRRNLVDLENKLTKEGLLLPGQHLDENNIDSFIQSTENVLLKYRLHKYKSHLFGTKEKRKEFVKKHIDNVTRHLSRIYHLRNELVHEAAIKQDIEDLTSNLRYYLILVVTKIVSFVNYAISTGRTDLTIEFFFYEMDSRRMLLEDDWSIESLVRKYPED